MIADFLPRYREVYGNEISCDILRSIVIDGHEVAWAVYSIAQPGEKPLTSRSVFCECDFTEGVGWEIREGGIFSLFEPEECLKRQAALHLRRLELRAEYIEMFKGEPFDSVFALVNNTSSIILDLIKKREAGEFIGEDSNGAESWGGYFYLQTVADITGRFVGHLWEDVHRLMAEKKIGVVGTIITAYSEPPPSVWDEYSRIEDDGWVGTASLPGYREMAREWKLELLKPDGTPVFSLIPGLALLHDPVFGPDAEDVTRAENRLRLLIREAKQGIAAEDD